MPRVLGGTEYLGEGRARLMERLLLKHLPSGEHRSHLCRLGILGYLGFELPKRGSGVMGNKLISVQTTQRSPLTQNDCVLLSFCTTKTGLVQNPSKVDSFVGKLTFKSF